jgi:hypothetical protein
MPVTKGELLRQVRELIADVDLMGDDRSGRLSPMETAEILERHHRLRAAAVEIGDATLVAMIEDQERKLTGKGHDS